MSGGQDPAVWMPAIRAGTGADVFTQRLCDALNAAGVRAEISWLPHRAEHLPWTVRAPQAPAWANLVQVNSWLPRRFWPPRLPTVLTVHHLVHDPAYRPFRSLPQAAYHQLLIRRRELLAIRDAAAITVGADYVRKTAIEFSGREDINVIHNWVDIERFAPPADPTIRQGRPFRLFMAGSHSRRKGFDLLPAFAQALGPGMEIRYAGGKATATSALANVSELGRISEAELVSEYQQCDAVVSLSRYEGFGYTALEAMACGVPFVGFRTSALAEVADNDLLAENGDVAGLATVCGRLASDPNLVSKVAMQGMVRAKRFSRDLAIKAYCDVYRSVLKLHP